MVLLAELPDRVAGQRIVFPAFSVWCGGIKQTPDRPSTAEDGAIAAPLGDVVFDLLSAQGDSCQHFLRRFVAHIGGNKVEGIPYDQQTDNHQCKRGCQHRCN